MNKENCGLADVSERVNGFKAAVNDRQLYDRSRIIILSGCSSQLLGEIDA